MEKDPIQKAFGIASLRPGYDFMADNRMTHAPSKMLAWEITLLHRRLMIIPLVWFGFYTQSRFIQWQKFADKCVIVSIQGQTSSCAGNWLFVNAQDMLAVNLFVTCWKLLEGKYQVRAEGNSNQKQRPKGRNSASCYPNNCTWCASAQHQPRGKKGKWPNSLKEEAPDLPISCTSLDSLHLLLEILHRLVVVVPRLRHVINDGPGLGLTSPCAHGGPGISIRLRAPDKADAEETGHICRRRWVSWLTWWRCWCSKCD